MKKKFNWSESSKKWRAKQRAAGLCIFGCGNPSTRPSGLCEACAKTGALNRRHHYKPVANNRGITGRPRIYAD